MTRDEEFSGHIRDILGLVEGLHRTAESFEYQAVADRAEMHAVLYGKIADELSLAVDALLLAADLADPATTVIDG